MKILSTKSNYWFRACSKCGYHEAVFGTRVKVYPEYEQKEIDFLLNNL